MKRILSVCLLLFLVVPLLNCERDDICGEDTPTTPRIVVEFYDYLNPEVLKNVINLGVKSVDNDSTIVFTTGTKVFLPLKTDSDTVTLDLTINFDENPATTPYTDQIQFNYARREVYVSRACGYKTTFTLSESNPPPFLLNGNTGTTNWIRNIIVDNYNIEDENETHIRIFY
ncbi:MAG: hypothetical protein EOP06_13425 [Proteobacteria bacterium]|nr:MAG: hypothetical protein EOP06_13425 [Pseudomonadota bacterium]